MCIIIILYSNPIWYTVAAKTLIFHNCKSPLNGHLCGSKQLCERHFTTSTVKNYNIQM